MQLPSKDEIMQLPLYDGLPLKDIIIVEDQATADAALAELKGQSCLGFDTESKPIFKKGVISPGPTLIQLATEFKAYLFPTRFESAKAVAKVLLGDKDIEKVGFGLSGDRKELKNKLDIKLENEQDLAITIKKLIGVKNQIGARSAVAMVLNKRLLKGAQKSNWGAYPLKVNQIQYAANDAHSALCVAKSLKLF